MSRPPNERTVMIGKLRALARKHLAAVNTLARLEEERAEMYAAARQLDPPMTYRAIAAEFGVTEAAVMQHLTRRAAKLK